MSNSTSPSSAIPRPTSADTESLSRSWRKGVTPTPNLNVVEWAERYRRLSKESSNGGRFIVSRVEVARGPMLAATEPGVGTITLMACTQLLKTTVIENILGRFIHIDPCPILVVQPKDDAAETFSKDRLAPMIRDTAVLKEIFGDLKSRDAGATLTHKQFPGGHITLVGSNSPTNLAMRPIRLLTCDEIDKRNAKPSSRRTAFRFGLAHPRSRAVAPSRPPTRRATSARPSSSARAAMAGTLSNGRGSASTRTRPARSGPRLRATSAWAASTR
jgi:phage terminase large subunit GpA-like protein